MSTFSADERPPDGLRRFLVNRNPTAVDGTKTDIWSVVCIGEGNFRHTVSDSVLRVSGFNKSHASGAIAARRYRFYVVLGGDTHKRRRQTQRVQGWRIEYQSERMDYPLSKGGRCLLLSQDCIVLSVHPPEPAKCPFMELRMVIPVRLTTDSWGTDGSMLLAGSEYSIPSTPSPDEGQVGQQHFGEYRDSAPY